MNHHLHIIIATLLIIVRTILFPFAIIMNFIKLRYHRRKYKSNFQMQYEKFNQRSYYLPSESADLGTRSGVFPS